jgi:cytochrome c-type biogenesis protein CcmF
LGWGGWWSWDPVENASFMPWLVGTALLHCETVVEKRDALKIWTILLAIVAFGFSLLGTFLVRSGIITSVHAFAEDPERGLFVLGILAVALGGSFALFAWRAPKLQPGGLFAPISREGALVLNNLLLGVGAATVLLGTLYPLALSVLNGGTVSVGAPYYVATFVPLMVPMVLLMAVGPLLGWKRGDLAGASQRLAAAGVLALFAAGFTLQRETGHSLLAPMGIALGVWLLLGTLIEWVERVKLFRLPPRENWNRARHLPHAAYGMSLAHAGLAIAIIGMTGSSAWRVENVQAMKIGDSVKVGDFDYRFEGVAPAQGPNYIAEQATFAVTRDGKPYTMLYPERRQYEEQETPTTEAAIESNWKGDLYAVIGDRTGQNTWTVRIYHQPLVPWIWAGGLLMTLGGLVSLSDRRYRIGVPNRLPVVQATGA